MLLPPLVGRSNVNEPAKPKILRKGEERTVMVNIAELPALEDLSPWIEAVHHRCEAGDGSYHGYATFGHPTLVTKLTLLSLAIRDGNQTSRHVASRPPR